MGVAPSGGDPGARYRASRRLPCNRHSRRREARPPSYMYKSVAGRARNAPATHPRAVAIRLPSTKPPCTRVTGVGAPHGPPRTGSPRRHVAERSRRLPPAIATFIVRAASDRGHPVAHWPGAGGDRNLYRAGSIGPLPSAGRVTGGLAIRATHDSGASNHAPSTVSSRVFAGGPVHGVRRGGPVRV